MSMLTLLSGSGAQSYSLLSAPAVTESQARALRRCGQLLREQALDEAATLLESHDAKFVDATNDFGDEFVVLHLRVGYSQYLQFKSQIDNEGQRRKLRAIQEALGDVGAWPRFILCDLDDSEQVLSASSETPTLTTGSAPTRQRLRFISAPPIDVDPLVASLDSSKVEADVRIFQAMLDAKVVEHELHAFLAARSYFFNNLIRLYGSSPLYSKVKLGSEFEVDFACFDSGSSGPEWHLIELEPAHSIFNKAGNPSAHLTHAIRQVLDWQNWVHENLGYARTLMPHVHYPLCWVFIGRRAELTSDTRRRLKALQREHRRSMEIHTLDWFADAALSVTNLLQRNGRGNWPLPMHALGHSSLARGLPPAAQKYMKNYFRDVTQTEFSDESRNAKESREPTFREFDDPDLE